MYTYQAGQEVEDDVEDDSRYKLDRNICNDTSECFGERMNEGIRSLLLDDRPLVV